MTRLEISVEVRDGNDVVPLISYSLEYDPETEYAQIADLIKDVADLITELLKEEAKGGE